VPRSGCPRRAIALTDAPVFAASKYQPHLERRHAQLKGLQLVAPVFLKDPARIEGLLCCHFVALVIQASVERQIRTAMVDADTEAIPPNPKERDCGPPSAPRVLEIFARRGHPPDPAQTLTSGSGEP
jgi:transposase